MQDYDNFFYQVDKKIKPSFFKRKHIFFGIGLFCGSFIYFIHIRGFSISEQWTSLCRS